MKKIFILLMLALMTVTAGAQQLYLCGDSPVGNGWGYAAENQVAMTLEADGYTNTVSLDVTGAPYFCVSTGGGTSWDDFNTNYRYSCSSFNGAESGTYQFAKLGDHAVPLTAGHYDISINARTMKMTLTFTPAAPPLADTYSVVGDGGLGLAWNPSDESLVMTKKSETLYELVRENVMLVKGTKYYWRILLNATTYGWTTDRYGASGKNAGEGDDNIVSTFDETALYTVTFTLDLTAGDASVPTVAAVKTGDCPSLYVDDQTGWSPLKVYAWGDAEIFGSWGSTSVTDASTVEVNGVTYHKLTFAPNNGVAHLIFFNGNGDTGDTDPTRALFDIIPNHDSYLTVSSGSATESAIAIVTAKEYTTYVTTATMDFTGLAVEAYKAVGATASSVTLEQVTEVPAGTPLILKGQGTFVVPVIASAAAIDGNLLVAGDGTTTIGGESRYDYILSDGKFYRANEGTVTTGKAYLHLDSAPSGARELNIVFAGETTGISEQVTANSEKSAAASFYNLNGQRITRPVKGLYIVNGKKYIVK